MLESDKQEILAEFNIQYWSRLAVINTLGLFIIAGLAIHDSILFHKFYKKIWGFDVVYAVILGIGLLNEQKTFLNLKIVD